MGGSQPGSLSMGFSRQEYWSGLPCPPQGRSSCIQFSRYFFDQVKAVCCFLFWRIFSSILFWQFCLSTLRIYHPTFSWPTRFLLRNILRSKWRLFSSSSLSAIRVVSSAYLRLLIFLPAILIPAYASSSPAFLMMYSAYKLNKQGDNIQPWCTPFPIWNQSFVPCPVLTVASWLAYRFLKRQVRWSGIPISFRIFHSLLWSTQSKALAYSIKQKYIYFWNSLLFWRSSGCWQFDLWFLCLF